MKNFIRISFIVVLTVSASYAKASGMGKKSDNNGNNNNDTTTQGIKSNIVIFRMIPSPATNNPSNTNGGGSLKKAGKVARTSYSHTSIENILYNKRGI